MELKKELKLLDIFCIALGTMISSGIFVLPSLAYAKAGPSIFLAFLLGGCLASLGVMSLVELGTAMPKAGGDYFYVTRSMGPVFGTVSGTISFMASLLETAFSILGVGTVISYFLYENYHRGFVIVVALLTTVAFTILNLIGVDFASKFERLVVFLTIICLSFFLIIELKHFNINMFHSLIQVYDKGILKESHDFFSLDGLKSFIYATSFVFVVFGGFTSAISTAEEVQNPRKNIPYGLFGALLLGTLLISFVSFVNIGILSGNSFTNSLYPIADAGKKVLGTFGYKVVLLIALFAFISTANAGILSASRYPLALSRDGLYHSSIGKIHHKYKTPFYSVYLSGVIIIILIFLPLEVLAKLASSVVFATLIFTNIAIIILRESQISNYRPTYKIPFYPVLPITAIFIYYIGLSILGFKAIFIMALVILIAVLIYFKYGKNNYSKEYAFQHLILKLSETVNIEHSLETELREIITSRDEIEHDNFDRLVTNSIILDLKGPITLDELIDIEAQRLSQITNFDKDTLIQLFKERENLSSTAFTEFTAIPHIVVDRDDFFNLTIIRCREGIEFNENFKSVKSVFLFISSKNLRKEHLHTLASIANLVRDINFEELWLNAKNENYIRDLILLSERKRVSKLNK